MEARLHSGSFMRRLKVLECSNEQYAYSRLIGIPCNYSSLMRNGLACAAYVFASFEAEKYILQFTGFTFY
jgi:hypothetical protein